MEKLLVNAYNATEYQSCGEWLRKYLNLLRQYEAHNTGRIQMEREAEHFLSSQI